MTKKKKQYANGGIALASVKGYHSLLSQRAHGKISRKEFDRRSKVLLAKLAKNAR